MARLKVISTPVFILLVWSAGLRSTDAGSRDFRPKTKVSVVEGKWHINGAPTYQGARAEGLLLNVRMVNSVFEDRQRPEFDPAKNTSEIIAQIPDYVGHGVRAFTICLQGGMPGYEGAVNSAFEPDGTLRDTYLGRVRRVVAACDRHGAVVILGCYYQRQDQRLRDEQAVRAGVVNVARWIKSGGFTNIVLEIANEYPHPGFDHKILRRSTGQCELIRLARQSAPGLLVSTSGLGDGKLPDEVAEASDYLLIHFGGVAAAEIPSRVAALTKYKKPIVCNEDDKTGAQAVEALERSVASGASWGLMLEDLNQRFPFTFKGAADDPLVYARMKQLAVPPDSQRQGTSP